MNRNRILVLLVAVACVAALAVAAATVDVPRDTSPGAGPGSGGGTGGDDGPAMEQTQNETSQSVSIPPFFRLVAVVMFALSILVVAYLALRTLGPRHAVYLVASMLFVGVVIVVAFLFIDSIGLGGNQSGPPQMTPNETGGGEGGRQIDADPKQSFDVPIALLGVFGLLAAVLVVAIVRFSGDESAIPSAAATTTEETAESDGDIRAVGEAAGRAADELEAAGSDVENTVFRAWREMTDALEVDRPETTSPEEFATIAVDAGMAPEDVRELTWLFEEVRYGDAPVTEERESRASEALRRIEDTYAGVDDGGVRDE